MSKIRAIRFKPNDFAPRIVEGEETKKSIVTVSASRIRTIHNKMYCYKMTPELEALTEEMQDFTVKFYNESRRLKNKFYKLAEPL